MIKWFAAILMILNVIVFLRVSDRQVENGFVKNVHRPNVNKESMLLLKEVNAEGNARVQQTPGVNASLLAESPGQTAIFDGRNIYNPKSFNKNGLKYFGIGRGVTV